MFSWGESSKITLGQQARQNVALYQGKRQEYLDNILQSLITTIKSEVLYQASIGCRETTVGVDQQEKQFPEHIIGTEERPKIYKLTDKNRKWLLDELELHFTDKEKYPDIECRQFIRGYGSPKFCIHIQLLENEPEKDES